MLTSASLAWKWVSSMAVPKLRFKDSGGREFPEWEERKLGTIANFIRGLSFNKNEVSNNKEDTLVIRSSNILENYRIDYKNDLQFVTKASSEEQFLKANDIVICLANGSDRLVGKSAYFDGNYLGKITVGAFCGILRTSNPVCKYLIQTWKYKQDISKIKQGGNGALANLYGKDILELNVFVPFFSEQQKIADFLTAYDTMIDTQTKRVEAMKLRKKGLLQKIFSQEIRFKDDEGREFPEWEEKTLEKCTNLLKDGTHGTHENVNDGYPLLSAKDIIAGKVIIPENSRLISKSDFQGIYKNYIIQEDDILLTIVGTIGRVGIYKSNIGEVAFQRSVAIIRVNDLLLPLFLYYEIEENRIQTVLKKRQSQSAQAGVYLGELAKIIILVPSLLEQQKIADFLTAVDKQIEVEEKRLETMKTIKTGLLQQMFV